MHVHAGVVPILVRILGRIPTYSEIQFQNTPSSPMTIVRALPRTKSFRIPPTRHPTFQFRADHPTLGDFSPPRPGAPSAHWACWEDTWHFNDFSGSEYLHTYWECILCYLAFLPHVVWECYPVWIPTWLSMLNSLEHTCLAPTHPPLTTRVGYH